jgi:2,4-dienoyl-CoA reductase-like NADH-dependent reductase (Old Yellow Enzyme family)
VLPPDGPAAKAFEPAPLGPLRLRNRLVKAATYEGMTPGGTPSDALITFHRELAAGGVAMTTVAYGAVSPDGRTFGDQLCLRPEIVPGLRSLADAVHAEGAAASIQLAHAGFFSKVRRRDGTAPRGPSTMLNPYGASAGVPLARAMTEADLATVIDDFGRAAALAVEAGFDAVEVHLGHGYLLSQFLSPATNRRRDAFGGPLANRLRLPLAVVARVRERIGPTRAMLAKTNLRDGFRGGLELDDAIQVVRALEGAGVDAVELSGGFTSRTPFYLLRGGRPLDDMIRVAPTRLHKLILRLTGPLIIRAYPFEELFFLPMARAVREAVGVPLVLLGGVLSLDNLATAMREGFDFVALGRALVADPDLPRRFARGEATRSRCISCNRCVAEMDRGGVRCVL